MHGIEWTHSERTGNGLLGTNRTLRAMAALVRKSAENPALRQRALEIVSSCPGHKFSCEIQALFRYCRDQIVYRRDPVEVEWLQDAERTLDVFGTGDCDDKVVCLASLLAVLGHKSRFVCIGKDSVNYSHVYLEVESNGRYVALDPTPEEAPAGWEARSPHRAVYEIWPSHAGLSGLAIGIALLWFALSR